MWAAPRENVHLGHARTAKTQIRLHGCAVWTGPSLSAVRTIGYNRMYNWKVKAPIKPCACLDDVNLYILRMLQGTFWLATANLYGCCKCVTCIYNTFLIILLTLMDIYQCFIDRLHRHANRACLLIYSFGFLHMVDYSNSTLRTFSIAGIVVVWRPRQI